MIRIPEKARCHTNRCAPYSLGILLFTVSALLSSCGENETEKVTMRLLYPESGLGDRSFSDSIYRGVRTALEHIDIYSIEETPDSLEQAKSVYEKWLDESPDGPEVLITVSQLYSPFIKELGCPDENRYFLHLDDALPDCPGRISVAYRTYAPSFMAGVAAVSISKEGKVAAIGGMNLPAVNEFIDGFIAGAQSAGGDVTEVVYLSEDASGFSAPEAAKEEALRLFESADVILPVAGGSSLGVIEAAKQYSSCYVVGIDADQAYLGRKVVLGSVVKNLHLTVEEALLDAANSNWESGRRVVGLEDNATNFVLNDVFAEELLPAVESTRKRALDSEKQYFEESR